MNSSKIHKLTDEYFSEKFKQFGDSPHGVDWNSIEAQNIRFDQVLKIISNESKFFINDLGCGYGALVDYLKKNRPCSDFNYLGYDLSSDLIQAAKNKTSNESIDSKINFFKINHIREIKMADYTVASGIFNKKLDFSDHDWLEMIKEVLEEMNLKSKNGFSFNMLTSYSDEEFKKKDLYYADPCWFFDYCKKNFSKNITLLHDYNLFDFTILVRKVVD